jgi:ELWxxDGT repeat protein
VHGRELWRSDGTEAGTLLLEDLEPGLGGSSPEGLVGHGTRLFFSADTTGRGREPWTHDGSIGGATPLDEIAPGPASSSPGLFVRSGWDLFFAADDGVTGRELWALPFRPPGRCGPSAL